MQSFVDRFTELIPVLLLSMFGGLIRVLNESKELSFLGFVIGCLTSAFTGVVVYYLIEDVHVSMNLKSAGIAIAGYCSKNWLLVFKELNHRFIRGVGK